MNAMVHAGDEVASIKHKVESIPLAMRNMGWTVSAELMERWLRSPAWQMPDSWRRTNPPDFRDLPNPHLDMSIVRMSWLLRYGRAQKAVADLRAAMANGPARAELGIKLKKLPLGFNGPIKVGGMHLSAIELDTTCQSNWISLGEQFDTTDDLHGALGRATLKVALIGEATRDRTTGRILFQVSRAGFYIRDTYDFNGEQVLGTWTTSGVLSKTEAFFNLALDGLIYRLKGEPIGNVFNQTLDNYRRLTGFGGDFVIYSDVHWEQAALSLVLN